MKKIAAIMGSPRKGQTYEVVKTFEGHLRRYEEVDFKYVFLKDLNIQLCRGCGLCLERGEEYCPLKDDREAVTKLMLEADGVIFAAPVYSLQVPAQLKTMLDRMAYVFHRPCFFHKAFIPIVTQGVYGDREVLKYLESVARFWGFKVCPGVGLTTLEAKFRTMAQQEKIDKELPKAAERFFQVLTQPTPSPRVIDVLIFRSMRSAYKSGIGLPRDYEFFRDNGWLESDYFYDTRLSPVKRMIGRWADWQGARQGEKVRTELNG